jgi:dinuclear metal center YbgI/SA1388 family protein
MLLSDFTAKCELLWPISGAEDWDSPGLVAGNPGAEVNQVLLAVDVTKEVLSEAIRLGANVIFTHHPLLLKGVNSVAESSSKGALLALAIKSDVAIFSAHTNADIVVDGVSDVIARRLGLANIEPLVPTAPGVGHGRVGNLPAGVSLGELVEKLVTLLPSSTRGVSASASADITVQRVALCGGAGDSFIGAAKSAGADVYVTSDLRHHVTQEAPLPLVDVSHWASESLWLETAAAQLGAACGGVEFTVSQCVTDPWIFNTGRTK